MKKTMDVKFQSVAEAFEEFLKKYHSGESRAIKATEINKTIPLSPRQIREVVSHLRLNGVPICSGSTGYYYAATTEELAKTKAFMVSHANAMLAAVEAMSEKENTLAI